MHGSAVESGTELGLSGECKFHVLEGALPVGNAE